jgi:hypothetical protein
MPFRASCGTDSQDARRLRQIGCEQLLRLKPYSQTVRMSIGSNYGKLADRLRDHAEQLAARSEELEKPVQRRVRLRPNPASPTPTRKRRERRDVLLGKKGSSYSQAWLSAGPTATLITPVYQGPGTPATARVPIFASIGGIYCMATANITGVPNWAGA